HPGKRVAGRPMNAAFYVPELVDPPTREVPAEDLALIADVLVASAPAPAVPRAEVGGREGSGRALRDHEARLTLLEEVPRLRTGVAETVDVRVENLGGETWRWGGE